MRDILADLIRWHEARSPIALATVVRTWGSSPRPRGAKMAVNAAGEITGSVSGGCVESAVAAEGLQAIQRGVPQLLHYGVADETAWQVGLACGGSLDVFVERLPAEQFVFLRELLEAEVPAATVTVVRGPAEQVGRKLSFSTEDPARRLGDLDAGLDRLAVERARTLDQPETTELAAGGQTVEAFIDLLLPPPSLIIVGGAHIAVHLAELARTMGYRTSIVDPRRAFLTEARFPNVDRMFPVWPAEAFQDLRLSRTTAVVTLSHDPKIDEPALSLALRSRAFYVGALGSKRTQARRRARLKEQGLTEAELDRLHGPVGLDLGAAAPEEIALSIMAEIVSTRNSRA
jgi:xanthine dehydrogenase accessory factor